MSTALAESPTQAAAGQKMSQLDQLKQFSKVVADTGDFGTIKAFTPQDATTNPSLIYAAVKEEKYSHLLDQAVKESKGTSLTGAKLTEQITDRLLTLFGTEILKIVPGRVSTETDARLSFDTEALVEKGRDAHQNLRGARHPARTRAHQDRLDLGRHPRGRDSSERGHPLQPDAAVLDRAGRRVRRGEGAAHLALRRPHLRLVQKGEQRRLHRRGGPWRAIHDEDLQLLQEVRLPDGSHGREFPQHGPDRRTGGLRPADDQPQVAQGTGGKRQRR